MTADERFLTEVKWEANLSAVWTSASQSHKAEARGRLLSDRIARIEQVDRLRAMMRRAVAAQDAFSATGSDADATAFANAVEDMRAEAAP